MSEIDLTIRLGDIVTIKAFDDIDAHLFRIDNIFNDSEFGGTSLEGFLTGEYGEPEFEQLDLSVRLVSDEFLANSYLKGTINDEDPELFRFEVIVSEILRRFSTRNETLPEEVKNGSKSNEVLYNDVRAAESGEDEQS